jgi:hypothetical protein
MDNCFEIPVTYQLKEYHFPAELITYGYSYKIEVNIFDQLIAFEPDEEGNFRALVSYEDLQQGTITDKALLEAIAAELVVLFRD